MDDHKRLVIIDGKSVFYRGYYAMPNLSTRDGQPTGAIYGFAAIAMTLVQQLRPTKVVVAWDSKTSANARREIYPDYKKGRVKPGADFYAQIPRLEKLVHALGWGFMECDRYEADDIIGTLSQQADNEFNAAGQCVWDTYIISSDLDMLQIVDKNTRMYRILHGFSELEELDVPAVEAKYHIKKSQFLDFKALKGDASDNIPGVAGIGEKTAAKLLADYGTLENLYDHLDEIASATRKKLVAGAENAKLSKQLAQIQFDAPVQLADVPDLVIDAPRIQDALNELEFYSLIKKFDLGTPKVATGTTQALNLNQAQAEIRELGENLLIETDIKSAMHRDPQTAEQILAGRPYWDLAQAEFLIDPLRRPQFDATASLDTEQKVRACAEQYRALKTTPRLLAVYQEFDLPLIPVLYRMEKRGMHIDRDYFAHLKADFEARLAALVAQLEKLAGQTFNPNSPAQLSEILFGKLGLPTAGIKKTKSGYSTGAKELAKLADQHPIVSVIVEYREVAKLLSTYVLPLPELADADSRIHTTFTQNITATGRLSSLSPNLQNIPVRTAEGRKIRTGFAAPAGRMLVSADYSQFELRLAAVLAGDAALVADFNANVDIHTKTAAEAFGVNLEQVTKKQRRAAKVINFGILYGMSARGLSEAAGMSFGEARDFINHYFELRAPLRHYLDRVLEQAKNQGYVETYFGRRKPTPDVNAHNQVFRRAAERAAQNMPIQGTEADLMKRAMIRVAAQLPSGAELIMQVHDSLIVECKTDQVTAVAQILRQEMENVAPELAIKLAVEVTSGQNWGEL